MKTTSPDLVLVHGVFAGDRNSLAAAREGRTRAFDEHAAALGVNAYEWVDGRRKGLANTLLRLARGTARPVDAVEIIALDEDVALASLATDEGRDAWRQTAGCKPYGLDETRSFVLAGAPRQLLEGPRDGQRVLWLGNGLNQLSRDEFVAHYTTRHGPLVASHARVIGLRNYRQVPGERDELCDSLRALGMGQALPPAVFAELVMGMPAISLAGLAARRNANREIAADEKRHIDFGRSMLVLA